VLEGYRFDFVASLDPERDETGTILESNPHERFPNPGSIPLNRYGHGPFCEFGISVPKGMTGVYALVVAGSVRYVGVCQDLGRRFNANYGHISPQDCYVGGQSTNCKVNHLILDAANAGEWVDLYFHHATSDRLSTEAELITKWSPPWNGRRAVSAGPVERPRGTRLMDRPE